MADREKLNPETSLDEAKEALNSVLQEISEKYNAYDEVPPGFELDYRDPNGASVFLEVPANADMPGSLQSFIDSISLGSKNARITHIHYYKYNLQPQEEPIESLEITLDGGEFKPHPTRPFDMVDLIEETGIKLEFSPTTNTFSVKKFPVINLRTALEYDNEAILKQIKKTVSHDVEARPTQIKDLAKLISNANPLI